MHQALILSPPNPHVPLLRHLRILLLKALAQALGALEELVDAAHHAPLFPAQQALGGEVADAIVEAALHEVGVHLRVISIGCNGGGRGLRVCDVRS